MTNLMKCEFLTAVEHQVLIFVSVHWTQRKIFQFRKRFSFSKNIRYLEINCSQRHGDAKKYVFWRGYV